MSAIFISHSSKDNAIAGEVKAKLLEQGHHSVFLDFDPEDGIPAGRNWEKELYARLRGCQAVIVLCSEHSMTSRWCFAETTQARSLGKHLFPLKVAACQISPLLSDFQVTDLTLNPIEGYQRLWSGLKKVGLDPADLFDWDGTRPPYPGLLAFQEQDAAVYFGRDTAIQGTIETLNRLQRLGGSRLVLVLGASGSGKSSLLRAGVVPKLKRDKDRWLVLDPFRPLGRPFDGLSMVLAGTFASFGKSRDWKSIRDALNPAADSASGAHLLDLANDLRVAAGRREATILLAIDQFEELLGRDTDQSASLFFRWLKAVLSQPSSPFLAVATLRSDFLGAFQTHEAIRDLRYEPLPLPQMALADYAQVIEGPARIAGVELEAGLAQAMVADTATDDALPLLAFTLRELWDRYSDDERLTLGEYQDRLGGLQGSLARAAEALFAERTLSEDEELHLRKAFLSMVRVDEEGRYVRRPARWTELPEDVLDLLERFVKARLLVSHSEGAERILEVAHEALFRSWDRLVAWLNADREFLLWRQRLRVEVDEWARTGHDAGALLRGVPLAEAERWLRQRTTELSPKERDYISEGSALRKRQEEAEIEQRKREIAQAQALAAEAEARRKAETERAEEARRSERRARKFSGFLVAFLLIAVISALVAFVQMDRAKYQARRSSSNELAAAAIYNLRNDPERSVLLALHGVLQTYADHAVTPGAEDALHRAVQASRVRLTLSGHTSAVHAVAFSPDGTRLATTSEDRTAKIWDTASGKELLTLSGHSKSVWGVAFSPDGVHLATASEDRTATLWDAVSGKQLNVFYGPSEAVVVAFSSDGMRLATAYADGMVRVWDVASGKQLLSLSGHNDAVRGLSFSPDGMRLATASKDRTAKVWDAVSGKDLLSLSGHTDEVKGIAFSPDGTRLATASHDGTAKVWDATSGKELITLDGHIGEVWAIAFSPDGTRLATASWDKTARVWDPTTGKELLTLLCPNVAFRLAFSPDGTRLATVSLDQIEVWDVTSGKEVLRTESGPSAVLGIAFSPDGTRLATAKQDGTTTVRDATSGEEFLTLSGHYGQVLRVTFSPNGTRLATASEDGTAKVWDAASGMELLVLSGHNGQVTGAAFSPDGKRLATASEDATVQVYLMDVDELIKLARTRITRSLTVEECRQYLHRERCPLPTP